MDFLYLADTSDTPPTKPLNPVTGYPSNGDPVNGKAPTTLGAWIFYAWSEEFKNLLATLGIVPDANNLHQLADYFARYKAEIAAMLPGDMTDYATKMKDIDNKLSNLDLFKRTAESTYAKTADVDKKLGSYVTSSSLTTTLQPYAKTGDLSAYARTSDLISYAKKEQLSSLASNGDVNEVLGALNNKADKSALNSKANSSDLNNYVRKEGDRGVLKGYSRQEHRDQNGGTLTIDINSPDDLSVNITGNVTVQFTKPEEGPIGTKVIHFWTIGNSTITWQNCTWSGGNPPTYGNPSMALIVVARFSRGWTYTSAFVNTQG